MLESFKKLYEKVLGKPLEEITEGDTCPKCKGKIIESITNSRIDVECEECGTIWRSYYD